MQNARVIVIGAGISGIGCAAKLIENGFKNVTILEAENRIGGRVNTVPFAFNVVDLGAQWCHGEKGNVVYDLVRPHGVLSESDISYPNVNFISSTGKNLDDSQCSKLVALCQLILENCDEDMKNYKGSLGSYVISKYQESLRLPEFADIDSETSSQVLEYFHKFENSIEASDNWFDTSGNGYLSYHECEGHPLLNWKDKGYKFVIDFITKQDTLDVKSRIQYNKEVSAIDWMNPARNSIKIKCSDGSEMEADHVVVTVSLGVLKENHRTMFIPQLPPMKVNAIDGLSFGTVDKIFLQFEKPFWNEDWAGFSLLWTASDSEEIRNTSNAWVEDVFGFYKVDYQPNILCGWISGPSARDMEKLDDAAVMEGCLFLFEKFLNKNMPWTKPLKMMRSTWHSNKHFRGSYSYRSITTDLLRTSASHLAHPLYDTLGKPSILFGGEATSDHYYSTVHGALEAGWREAGRLSDFYASQSNSHQFSQILMEVPTEIQHFDALVLGAGISGLGAGKVFKDENMNFLILEGQDRVGGRINTVALPNASDAKISIDAGAQWLHGKNNELFHLANKHDLIRPELSEEAEGDYMTEDGVRLNDFFVKKVDFKFGQILEECESFVKSKNGEKSVVPKSVESFVNEKFEIFLRELGTEEERKRALQLLDWHRKFQIIDNSCIHFAEISAKSWGNYSFNGEDCQTHINMKDGMGKVVEKLEKSLKSNTRLKKNVDLVYWRNEDNLPSSTRILVSCDDGSVYSTNNLICTFSLGVLKENSSKIFHPHLPHEHQRVIGGIGYGTINKIFLHYEKKWWADDWKGLQLLWNENLDDKSHWTKYISGFDVVYPEPSNTLLAWIGGKGAIEMEKLSDKEIMTECSKLLSKFLKNSAIPNPDLFYCSRWNSNKFIRGAYSFTSTKTDHIEDWEKVISKPVTFESSSTKGKKNLILFAGEGCHESYFSTVHGAFQSGIEQAKMVVNSIKEKNIASKL